MAFLRSVALIFVNLAVVSATASREGVRLSVNPVRRVISMLQVMQNKIDAEGKEEKRLFDKFMCYCQSSASNFEKDVADGGAKIPQLESELEESTAEKGQLERDVAAHTRDRAAAQAALAQAAALRQKESAEFGATSSEGMANIAAMEGALEALDEDSAAAFLQSSAANALRRLTLVGDFQRLGLSDADREEVTTFLQQQDQGGDDGEADASSPDASIIRGILKQMKETMRQNLVDAAHQEQNAAKDFASMEQAKKQEAASLAALIQDKTERLGEVTAELETLSSDLGDANTAAIEDKKLLAELSATCEQRKSQWESRSKTRTEEVQAISGAIRTLNDGDALSVFKAALPRSTSVLLQTDVSAKEMIQDAREVMKSASSAHGGHDVRLDLISLALHGKKVSFNKVLKMVDDMVTLLDKEQKADERKKSQCESDIHAAEDEKVSLADSSADLEKKLDEERSVSQSLAEEIKELEDGVVAMDKEVKERSSQRREEHHDFGNTLASNHAASQVLRVARGQLSAFYDRKAAAARANKQAGLVTQAVVAELVQGGDSNAASVSFLQISKKRDQPTLEAFGEYPDRSQDGNSVLGLIDTLVGDLAAEFKEMQTEEAEAQHAYEQFVSDASEKRALDGKSLTEKAVTRADVEASLRRGETDKKNKNAEVLSNGQLLQDFHASCDELLQTFVVRKEARANERKSLLTAKDILAGTDYTSLLQTGHGHQHLRKAA